MKDSINPHLHHRQRLKNRFLSSGLGGFEAHNALELLLFFSIPQGDTNVIAHRLIDKFGSFSNVFSAPYEELLKVDGVGPHTATFIKLIPELLEFFSKDKLEEYNKKSLSISDIANLLMPYYIGVDTEVVRAVLLDNNMRVVDNFVLFKGDVNSANLTYKDIVQNALNKNAPNIVLAHNHPMGSPIASTEDILTTEIMRNSLRIMGLNLVEHLVIAGDRYTMIVNTLNKRTRN